VAEKLGLPIVWKELNVSTILEEDRVIPSGLTSMRIENVEGTLSKTIGVGVMDKVCENLKIRFWSKVQKEWSHLLDVHFPEYAHPLKV
jgi:hypothetical protein